MQMPEGKQLFWEQNVGGILAQCHWEKNTYTVTVSRGEVVKTESFGQTFTPVFGMDAADVRRLMEIAEKLATEIEKGDE